MRKHGYQVPHTRLATVAAVVLQVATYGRDTREARWCFCCAAPPLSRSMRQSLTHDC